MSVQTKAQLKATTNQTPPGANPEGTEDEQQSVDDEPQGMEVDPEGTEDEPILQSAFPEEDLTDNDLLFDGVISDQLAESWAHRPV